jgi:hypothetical protein
VLIFSSESASSSNWTNLGYNAGIAIKLFHFSKSLLKPVG